MKILLTGCNGQVGWELERALAPLGEVIATDHATLDIADLDAVRRVVREVKPDTIVNAAAYTAVDRAEAEPDLAMRVNGEAPGVLAEEAQRLGALLVHYSTDYVFDGMKGSPYTEDDAPNPLSVYGRTKLAGESAIRSVAARSLIFRTSWVYGLRGNNFLLTMLRAAREGRALKVVDDQHGTPTWARTLAGATSAALATTAKGEGLFNLVPGGDTTWHGFATEIFRLHGLKPELHAIATAGYPTAARRPKDSRLSNERFTRRFGPLPSWNEALASCVSNNRKLD